MTGKDKNCGTKLRKLRIHHLLCIPLFRGYGYSDGFCANMARVIRELEANAEEPLEAVCGADMICAGCPNLTSEHTCRTSGKNVEKKDRQLAEALGIEAGGTYTYRTLMKRAAQRLTEEIFTDSCENCQWFSNGLCSFTQWGLPKPR